VNTIGERIKYFRESNAMTAKDFGARIGLGNSSVSKIEKGVNGTTDQTIKSICREFHVREQWLRTGEGEMYEPKAADDMISRMENEYNLSSRESAIIKAFLNLDATDRAAVMRYVDGIVLQLVNLPDDGKAV